MPTPPLPDAVLMEAVEAVSKHGSISAAAASLNIARSTMQNRIARAAMAGHSPEHGMTKTAPVPYIVKGVSSYYNKDGVLSGQWVKTSLDMNRAEEVTRAFVESMSEEVRGLSPVEPRPKFSDIDLLTVYPMGDPHFGMYAWAKEAGDDFDLKKAESLTTQAIDRLVASSPDSKTALLLNLGDFFHADDSSNMTPSNGHPLDVDTRYAQVLQVGLRALVHCILRLLRKHEQVIVWMMPGNHDTHSSFALALCLSAYFENNKRVTVDLSPSLYKYFRFGQVLIGAHHGHGAKMQELPLLMASDKAEDWGKTKHRYWYCGHIHHMTRDKEHPGCVVETFRTLAPRDAWHAGKGYRAGRDMYAITHHRAHGEFLRTRCDVSMLSL